MTDQSTNNTGFVIPPTVVTKVDIARLLSEAETLDNDLTTAAIRTRTGASASPPPIISEQLTDFLTANQLKIDDDQQRQQLIAALRQLKSAVPTVHLTFASVADQTSLQQIVTWLRQSIHPQAVMTVGLQPSLIGGVYVRTANQVFDLSVRAQLANHRGALVKELEALSGGR